MPKFVPLTDENGCPFYVNTDWVVTVDAHGTINYPRSPETGRPVPDAPAEFIPEAGLFDVLLGGGPNTLRLVTVKWNGTLGQLVSYLLNPDVFAALSKKSPPG